MNMFDQLMNAISIETLQNSELGMNLNRIMDTYEKTQVVLQARINDNSPDIYKNTKIGTVITFAVLSKLSKGINIKSFTTEDWKEIVGAVSQYAILMDGQEYSVFIFMLYADYIDASVDYLKKLGVSDEKCQAITQTSEQVKLLSNKMSTHTVSEVDYTEKCLWLLLEAMIKLLSTYSILLLGDEKAEFLDSVTTLAFEYGRYTLYKREQEILACYINNQYELDDLLSKKFTEYKEQLESQSELFNSFIDDAFSPNISDRLKSSVNIAIQAGVSADDILDSKEKIDDFFL